jgi:type 1 glutamine amidotransferase
MRCRSSYGAAAALFCAILGSQALTNEPVKPIRALLVVGGCCHDYDIQKIIISEGTAARAHIEWTVVQQGGTATNSFIPLYEKADWAKGFDIVVHDECFSDAKDPKWTETILKPHRDGLPAVVIHCALHCYRDGTGEWFKFVGVTSHRHGAHYGFNVATADPSSPIMKTVGAGWHSDQGELYQITKRGDNCKPLATARSRETWKDETCVWTNQFGNGRVFGTTLGHYNSEVSSRQFLDVLTRGILWACDKP